MKNKRAGQKRKSLKKRYDKFKRVEKNNLPKGQKFRLNSLKDLENAEMKAKLKK